MATPEFYSGKTLYPAIAAILALSALFALVVLPRLAPPGNRMVDQAAPDFTLPVVANGDQAARMQLSELRDKVVVIDFWASWCGPCAAQAPILDRVARKFPEEVVVLGVNVDDAPHVARRYAVSKGLSYPILSDEQGEVQRTYGVNTLPSIVVVDRQGKVSTFVQGVVRQSSLERVIRAEL